MKFDSRSVDAFGQVDLVANKAGIWNVAPLAPRRKNRAAAGRKAAMLAFAAGLLFVVLGAGAADAPARAQPTAERAGTESARGQPTAEQFATPNRPDVSASDAIEIDNLYRQLIGPPLETSSGSRSNTPTFRGSAKR
ncbi:MAG TPA: hypothetical protein VGI28_16075 [Stellaceae bacterium]